MKRWLGLVLWPIAALLLLATFLPFLVTNR